MNFRFPDPRDDAWIHEAGAILMSESKLNAARRTYLTDHECLEMERDLAAP